MDVCGAEEPRGFTVTAGADGECGEALEGVGNGAVCPSAGGGCERVVRVAVGLFGLTLRDRNAGARRQRQRQVKAARRRDGFVGQAPGRGQIPARQRGLGRVRIKIAAILGWRLMWGKPAAIASSAAATSPAARVATVNPA